MAEVPEASRDSMGSAKMLLLLLSMALLALGSAQDISNGTDTENSPEGPQNQEEETQPLDHKIVEEPPEGSQEEHGELIEIDW
ncbi:basic salivary proline-rich protein 3-like isoform X5 [Myotis yumanensis]|uniref:basic salivary proline-rich protein 3-like isoform X5 n=1 Tax=Myotis yumanensis TaxID=159337 RepID=UPI0038D1BA86